MPLSFDDTLCVLKQVTANESFKTTAEGVATGTCIVGFCAATGGLVGGPIGLSIGGLVGSFVTLVKQKDSYKSIPSIIMNMSDSERRQLVKSVENIFKDIDATDITMVVAAIMSNTPLHQKLLEQVILFLKNEMKQSYLTK